jgi:hypothetical protein
MKWGDIHVKTWDNLMAILWRDKRDICMLMNIHDAPAEVSFHNEGGKAIKPLIMMDYISITWAMWIRATEWPTVTPSASGFGGLVVSMLAPGTRV